MLKSLAALLLVLSPVIHAETNCTELKLEAADRLQAACASDAKLSAEDVATFQEISRLLSHECSDARSAETLDRGVLYKNLDLFDHCNDKAGLLANR
jgi:hypothetical protein